MKSYYECHITMVGDPEAIEPAARKPGWKFSAIHGDINLGDGLKCYLTTQLNAKLGAADVVSYLNETADAVQARGIAVVRRKVEMVLYDDRSSKVKPCDGACIDCHLDDYKERDANA